MSSERPNPPSGPRVNRRDALALPGKIALGSIAARVLAACGGRELPVDDPIQTPDASTTAPREVQEVKSLRFEIVNAVWSNGAGKKHLGIQVTCDPSLIPKSAGTLVIKGNVIGVKDLEASNDPIDVTELDLNTSSDGKSEELNFDRTDNSPTFYAVPGPEITDVYVEITQKGIDNPIPFRTNSIKVPPLAE